MATADRQDEENGCNAEVATKKGHAVSRRTEEQCLPEAHDAGIPPDEIEAQREQRQDEDASDENRK